MMIKMSESNARRLKLLFPKEQWEYLVNEVFDDAFTDFLIFLEAVDAETFTGFYKSMSEVSREEAL